MPDFLTADITVRTESIPAPPVEIDTSSVKFPVIGPFRIPNISFGPFRFGLPNISIPEASIPIPEISTDFVGVELPEIGPIPDVDVDLPYLDIDTDWIKIPVIDYWIEVIDPFGSELRGGDVDIDFTTIQPPGEIFIPDIDVATDRFDVGGQFFRLPDIDIPGLDVNTPDIPEFDLPDVAVPTGARLVGLVEIPDPTSIEADVSVQWGAVQSFVLGPIPAGFITEPVVWTFDAAVSELQRRVDVDTAAIIRDVAEGFFELLLSDETKQELQERNREQ